MTIIIMIKKNNYSVYVCMWTGSLALYSVAILITYDLKRLPSISPSLTSLIDIPKLFSLSLFLLWCTTTVGGWQQTTTIAITARAIRCRHRRWFRRLIIIALSHSGLSPLRSSTLLLSPSRRFHRSRCSTRTTTPVTSPTDIHDSYLPLLYFSFKKKRAPTSFF